MSASNRDEKIVKLVVCYGVDIPPTSFEEDNILFNFKFYPARITASMIQEQIRHANIIFASDSFNLNYLKKIHENLKGDKDAHAEFFIAQNKDEVLNQIKALTPSIIAQSIARGRGAAVGFFRGKIPAEAAAKIGEHLTHKRDSEALAKTTKAASEEGRAELNTWYSPKTKKS